MSVFEPVCLSADLKCDIRSLLQDLGLQACAEPGQTEPDPGATEPIRLSPQARIKSRYYPAGRAQGHLRIEPVSSESSPWDERYSAPWTESDMDQEGFEQQLQQEQTDREWRFQDRLRERMSLPIHEAKTRLLEAVSRSRVTLVAADTGSGKSTQVPQFVLDDAIAQGVGSSCHIVCTQPRRLAAVSLASRVAWERGERVAEASVGYVVRWDERPSRPWGSMVFCTVGSLLPRLSRLGASHIIVDEAHTRDIHTDLLLTVLLELLCRSADLKVIVMSATLDVSKWHSHFADFGCELVQAGGRPYQVNTYFLEDIVERLRWRPETGSEPETVGVWSELDCNRGFVDQEGTYSPATVQVVRSLPESMIPFHLLAAIIKWVDGWGVEGSVLVFLPGWHEIAVCSSFLHRDHELSHLEFVPLHSSVPPAEQQRAFLPARHGCRKVILGTDIAETSITIPDILCVIDSGLARIKKHTNLEVVWASQANLLQRAGRAGRVRQGTCVHLLTRSRFFLLQPEPTPEMQRVPLDEAVLALCELGLDCCRVARADLEAWGSSAYVMTFLKKAPDPPSQKEVRNAFRELQHIGALDWDGYLTHLGALLVRLPVAPALGAALFMAGLLGCPEAASRVAATLDGREVWARRPAGGEDVSAARHFAKRKDGQHCWSDVFALANALTRYEEETSWSKQRSFCKENGLIQPVLQQLGSARQQLRRALADLGCRSLEATDAAGTGEEGEGLRDDLESAWPIIQTMLAFAYGWNLGRFEGGRRVNAGWTKAARVGKNCVLVDEDPPCSLLTYVELTCTGGRVLRCASVVTPQQLLLSGGCRGSCWEEGQVILEEWLQIRAEYETAALLAALRTATSEILQRAASWSHDVWSKEKSWSEDRRALFPWPDEIQKWQKCVTRVACLPLPPLISLWDTVYSWAPDEQPFAPALAPPPLLALPPPTNFWDEPLTELTESFWDDEWFPLRR